MLQVFFSIRLPRPFARAEKRFIDWALSTWIVVTLSSSISAPSLCSALAIADSSAFFRMPAAFLGVKVRIFSAWATDLPRIRFATRRVLDRKRVVEGKSGAVRLFLGGRLTIKKK